MERLAFSIAAVKQALGRFDWNKPTPHGFAFEQYLDFYGLRFQACDQHIAGIASLGGYEIAVHTWLPASPRATVFIVHGYFDHVGLYDHLIGWALNAEFAVVAFDLPGHGLSSGKEAAIGDFEEYQRVLKALFRLAYRQVPLPWCCAGQSTGGGILLDYLLQWSDTGKARDGSPSAISHVALLAPLVRASSWAAVTTSWQLLHRFQPSVPRGFGLNSHDQAFMNFQKYEDPLQSRVVSTDWVGAMIRWSRRVQAYPACRDFSPLIIQGEADTTVDFEFNLPVLAEKFPAAIICRLPEARHHLVNESPLYREQMFQLIADYFP